MLRGRSLRTMQTARSRSSSRLQQFFRMDPQPVERAAREQLAEELGADPDAALAVLD